MPIEPRPVGPQGRGQSTAPAGPSAFARALAAARKRLGTAADAAPGWLGGAFAGAQAALFSLALVVIPLWVLAVAASDAEVPYGAATGMAAKVWLMGFGAPWEVGGVAITLLPLGTPLLAALLLGLLVRRFAGPSSASGVVAALVFSLSVAGVAWLAWSQSEHTKSLVLRAFTLALFVGLSAATWANSGLRARLARLDNALPDWARLSWRFAAAASGAVVVVSAAVLAATAIAGREHFAASVQLLGIDQSSGTALAALEMMFAPSLVIWMVAWMGGSGVNWAGQLASSNHPFAEPMPAIPLLGSLPQGSGGVLSWSPLLFVLVGAVVVVALASRLPRGMAALVPAAVGSLATGLIFAALADVASGAIGPGSLVAVGPEVLATGAFIGVEVGIGALTAGLVHAFLSPAVATTERAPRQSASGSKAQPASKTSTAPVDRPHSGEHDDAGLP